MRKNNFIPGNMLIVDAAIMGVLLFLDQFTKYLAISCLKGKPPVILIDQVLELEYLENKGIAFSLLQNQKFLILFMGIIVLTILIYGIFRLPREKKFCVLHILLSALVAGALGNIIDRIRFDYVVDFISFVLIQFPVFNLADCYITVCTILMFIMFMFVYREEDLVF